MYRQMWYNERMSQTLLQVYVSGRLKQQGSNMRLLAASLNMSHAKLYNLLKNASVPDDVLQMIALRLCVNVSELYDRVGKPVQV